MRTPIAPRKTPARTEAVRRPEGAEGGKEALWEPHHVPPAQERDQQNQRDPHPQVQSPEQPRGEEEVGEHAEAEGDSKGASSASRCGHVSSRAEAAPQPKQATVWGAGAGAKASGMNPYFPTGGGGLSTFTHTGRGCRLGRLPGRSLLLGEPGPLGRPAGPDLGNQQVRGSRRQEA